MSRTSSAGIWYLGFAFCAGVQNFERKWRRTRRATRCKNAPPTTPMSPSLLVGGAAHLRRRRHDATVSRLGRAVGAARPPSEPRAQGGAAFGAARLGIRPAAWWWHDGERTEAVGGRRRRRLHRRLHGAWPARAARLRAARGDAQLPPVLRPRRSERRQAQVRRGRALHRRGGGIDMSSQIQNSNPKGQSQS